MIYISSREDPQQLWQRSDNISSRGVPSWTWQNSPLVPTCLHARSPVPVLNTDDPNPSCDTEVTAYIKANIYLISLYFDCRLLFTFRLSLLKSQQRILKSNRKNNLLSTRIHKNNIQYFYTRYAICISRLKSIFEIIVILGSSWECWTGINSRRFGSTLRSSFQLARRRWAKITIF